MIHPWPSNSSSWWTGNSTRRVVIFYTVSLLLAAANFLPLLVESDLENETLPPSTEYYLSICYLLSLPLLFEYFLDLVVSQFSPSSCKTVEPRFGFFLVLLSLFLPVISVDSNIQDSSSPWKILSIICFVSFLQTLIVIGHYGKLQFRTKGHWQISKCIGIIFLYVASLVCLNLGIAYYHPHEDLTVNQFITIGCGIACAFSSLALHCLYSKRFILDYVRCWVEGVSAPVWQVDDAVAVALQGIIFTIFLFNCIAAAFQYCTENIHSHANSMVINHIVLGICAAIMPGRVIRKNFLLLHEKMAVKETFIRYVSHEIRSPLSTTSLGLNYLLDRLKTNEVKQTEVVEVVQESLVTCELALDTLNDFLMLDKIQSSMVEINTTMRLAADFMVDAIRPFSLQASSSNIKLLCNFAATKTEASQAKIDIDTYKMNQVLRNLLSNAFKFTPSGGSVSVTMTIQEYANQSLKSRDVNKYVDGRRHCVKFSVKDSGCGISAENLPKLFGQYVQFDAAKLQGGKGSGLGLWLSKAIVEMHGGRIGAESEGEGEGCTFWFEVPCVLSEEAVDDSGQLITARPTINAQDECTKLELCDIECGKVEINGPSDRTLDLNFKDDSTSFQESKSYVDLENGVSPPPSKRWAQLPRKSIQFDNGDIALPSYERKELKVLLVDDSAIARKMVERSLTSIGAVCAHACNGREAVEKVRQSLNNDPSAGYDVILMDHYMPEMSGPEAVEVIRNELGYKGVIMGVSGNASEFDVLLAEGKVNKVVMKPFNLDVFINCMNY